MRGDFTIDGISALGEYGVFVEQGGYASLVSEPSFKSIEIVDWLDEDGIDADLSSPVLEEKRVSVSFCFKSASLLGAFYTKLADNDSHTFEFPDIDRSFEMRLLSTGNLDHLVRMGKISLSFVIDEPAIAETSPYAIGLTRVTQRGFTLDNIDLSRFGCWVLDGTIQNYRKAPAVKENLVVSSRYAAGQTYFSQCHQSAGSKVSDVYFKSKDLTLNLLINARDIEEFWKCWDSLFYTITQSGLHTIKLGRLTNSQPCFYKSCSVRRFEVCQSGTIWCEFSLVLTLTSFRHEVIEALLAAENNAWVETEDGALIVIDYN